MTESLHNPSHPEIAAVPQGSTVEFVGHVAVREFESTVITDPSLFQDTHRFQHEIVLSTGEHAITTVPESVDLLGPDLRGIKPNGLDHIEPGSYDVELLDSPNSEMATRKIIVKDLGDGNRSVNESAFKLDLGVVGFSDGGKKILSNVGFGFSENEEVYYPSPQTLKRLAAEQGVDVELTQSGLISSKEFLGLYADKKYPVGTGAQFYYLHDIQDDHLPGIICGGEELANVLARVSSDALASGNEATMNQTTVGIDFLTTLVTNFANGTTSKEPFINIASGSGNALSSVVSREELIRIADAVEAKKASLVN